MIGEWTANNVVDTTTAGVLAAMALTVGLLAKFQGPARWFALCGSAFGLGIMANNAVEAVRDRSCGEGTGLLACAYSPVESMWGPVFSIAAMLLIVVATIGVVQLGRSYGITSKWYMAGFGLMPVAAPLLDGPAAIYRRQAREIWSDGVATPKERKLRRQLRDDLGLSLADADAIDREVER